MPDIKWIGLHPCYLLDMNDESLCLPLTEEDRSILDELCAKQYVLNDEIWRAHIHVVIHRGFKGEIEAFYPMHHYIRTTTIRRVNLLFVFRCISSDFRPRLN